MPPFAVLGLGGGVGERVAPELFGILRNSLRFHGLEVLLGGRGRPQNQWKLMNSMHFHLGGGVRGMRVAP